MTCHWEWLEEATRSKTAQQTSKKKTNFTDKKRWGFKPFVVLCRSFCAAAVSRVKTSTSDVLIDAFTPKLFTLGITLSFRGAWGSEYDALTLLNYLRWSSAVRSALTAEPLQTCPDSDGENTYRRHPFLGHSWRCDNWKGAKSVRAERDKILLNLQETSTNSVELVLSVLPSLFQCGLQENMIYMT